MAATKIISSRTTLKRALDYTKNEEKTLADAINYVENPEKTIADVRYVTGINCTSDIAADEMQKTKELWGKPDGIQYFHAIQSFKPGEIEPDRAHDIGIKLANIMWGEKYQVVVSTHLDKAHIHNHFIINSVSFLDGKKYHLGKGNKLHFRNLSDHLCLEHELSVITEPSVDRKKTVNRVYNRSHRVKIREDINRLVKTADNFSDLLHLLSREGYDVKSDVKHIAIRRPGMERFVRLRSLGDAFELDALSRRIERQKGKTFASPAVKKNVNYRTRKKPTVLILLFKIRSPYYVRVFRYYYRKFNKLFNNEPLKKQETKPNEAAIFKLKEYGQKVRIVYKYELQSFDKAVSFVKEKKGTEQERELVKEVIRDTWKKHVKKFEKEQEHEYFTSRENQKSQPSERREQGVARGLRQAEKTVYGQYDSRESGNRSSAQLHSELEGRERKAENDEPRLKARKEQPEQHREHEEYHWHCSRKEPELNDFVR